ncbi:MAG: hypothetical protein V4733_01115 [Verrucomicrobiota bacterium]
MVSTSWSPRPDGFTGKIVKVKAFDIDDSTDEAIDRENDGDSSSARGIDPNDRVGDDNLPDYLNTPKAGKFLEGGALNLTALLMLETRSGNALEVLASFFGDVARIWMPFATVLSILALGIIIFRKGDPRMP